MKHINQNIRKVILRAIARNSPDLVLMMAAVRHISPVCITFSNSQVAMSHIILPSPLACIHANRILSRSALMKLLHQFTIASQEDLAVDDLLASLQVTFTCHITL